MYMLGEKWTSEYDPAAAGLKLLGLARTVDWGKTPADVLGSFRSQCRPKQRQRKPVQPPRITR